MPEPKNESRPEPRPLVERIDEHGNWIEETGNPLDDDTPLVCGVENPEVCDSCQ